MGAVLRATNLWKSYAAGVQGCSVRVWALRSCAFTIRAGERIAIGGRTGSGKSSLLHCLAGLRALDAGHVDCSFGRIILSPHLPYNAFSSAQSSESTLFLVDDLATANEDALHPLLLMSQHENTALVVATRHLARVAPFVHQVFTLRDGRLSALPRTPVRRVAERVNTPCGTRESSAPEIDLA